MNDNASLPVYHYHLVKQLKRHEGFREFPYRDTVGKLTVGYGHNLDDVPLSERIAELILLDDLAREERRLERIIPWFKDTHGARRAALLNMAFNLGAHGLKKFRRMWRAIARDDWEGASREALDSKWARQVGRRATELAEQLRSGEYQYRQ